MPRILLGYSSWRRGIRANVADVGPQVGDLLHRRYLGATAPSGNPAAAAAAEQRVRGSWYEGERSGRGGRHREKTKAQKRIDELRRVMGARWTHELDVVQPLGKPPIVRDLGDEAKVELWQGGGDFGKGEGVESVLGGTVSI